MAVVSAPDVFKLGFIGAGNMAESIARGVATSGVLPPASIRTTHRCTDRRLVFQSFGVKILETNAQVVDDSDIIILSVKPQIAGQHARPSTYDMITLFNIKCKIPSSTFWAITLKEVPIACFDKYTVEKVLVELKPFFSEEKVLVSIAAGIKLKDLQEWSGQCRMIRVMPNTPAAVGHAASGEMATKKDEERVTSLFSAIGKVWTTDEKYFDAVTGLSGSGPAYIYLAIEALADGGVAAGLPRDLALGLASQTVLGAAAMVNLTEKHPGQLKDAVTSPAGTTIAGIQELERGAFRGTLMNAVVAATKRCRELSQT
ncbi:Pyrroline-5-carboxylate reductase [Cocos nucifera]|uniref:Pyrroline-5-carboxylate reductase n=1 Tax=Cocos nucifera TaxID=13894 RepID=A0A8K0I6C5_COCNU|nr:Pyrroline-5-carboxylate reductase [Cocos nucifera]